MSGELSGSADLDYPPRSRAWWAVCVFSLAAILSYTDRQILNLLVDPIRQDLGVSDIQVSLLQGAAFAVLYATVGLPLGRCADLLPRRWLMVGGVVLWCGATLASALAPSFGALFAARVCVGIGEAALAPAAISLIADYFPPRRRGSATGVFLMGMAVGSGVSITLGGLLFDAASRNLLGGLPLIGGLAPWRIALAMAAAPGALLVLLLLTVREPPRRRAQDVDAQPQTSLRDAGAVFLRLRRLLVPLYLAMALLSVAGYGIDAWTPAFLTRRLGLTVGEVATSLGPIAIVSGVLGALAGGLLSDRLGSRGGLRLRIRGAMAVAALALVGAGVGLASNAGAALALYGFWNLMCTAAGTMGITAVQDSLTSDTRGLGVSINAFGNTMLGLGLGPTLVAVSTESLFGDPQAVGFAMAGVAIPCAAAAVILLIVVAKGLANPRLVPAYRAA